MLGWMAALTLIELVLAERLCSCPPQDVENQLPLWLRQAAHRGQLPCHPDRLLLQALLRWAAAAAPSRGGGGGGSSSASRLQAVLAAYTATCILQEPEQQLHVGAEQRLLTVLAGMGQQAAALGTLGPAVREAAAAAARQRGLSPIPGSNGGTASSPGSLAVAHEEALRYFSQPSTLRAVAAGRLLLQALAAGAVSLETAFSPAAASPLELEVMALALLLPVWESVVARLSSGAGSSSSGCRATGRGASGQCPRPPWWELEQGRQQQLGAASGPASQPALPALAGCHAFHLQSQQLVAFLCHVSTHHPGSILALPPPLLAEACRRSFRLTASYAALLARQLSLQRHPRAACGGAAAKGSAAEQLRGGGDPLAAHVRHATKHADHVSAYLRSKLAPVNGTQSVTEGA